MIFFGIVYAQCCIFVFCDSIHNCDCMIIRNGDLRPLFLYIDPIQTDEKFAFLKRRSIEIEAGFRTNILKQRIPIVSSLSVRFFDSFQLRISPEGRSESASSFGNRNFFLQFFPRRNRRSDIQSSRFYASRRMDERRLYKAA